MNDDLQHLRLLSIFHYIVAAITFLVALFPVLHLMMGLSMVGGGFTMDDDPFPMAAMGWFFVLFPLLWILCGLALAVCLVLAARYLTRQTHYTFCLVVACVACVFFPVGTVLGVFTILVLLRDSVQERFQGPPAAQGAGA